ncbi:GntR family transcriptional regulator [Gracilibacillus ureilyticus]|uniref:GntR family transcriptional regulator n=1 Tax=Gracilibacillus ureilyticus TaxID=531814 RepID=A0A1H9UUB4_9BACI|nr:GntR family transcriptional regulator [Gracilibacillus ureilyticus]SES12603.1 GntR family transcriptional regulator [Gracilibacillus ureilyticus]
MKPQYMLIRDQILQLIEDGILKAGEKLPSEIEMAKKFKVSRETFRSAVKLLEKEGRLVVKRGAGTFVVKALPNIPNRLEKLGSVTNMIKSAGLNEGERRESIRLASCTKEWAKALQLKEGDSVIVNERIRTANDEPTVVSINIIPEHIIGRDILKEKVIGSLFAYLEEHCQVYITSADAELNVPLHTDIQCQKLLIRPETTVLMMKQLHYNRLNEPVLYSMDYFRNDVFQFTIRRVRN